jgi:hypothetical protein
MHQTVKAYISLAVLHEHIFLQTYPLFGRYVAHLIYPTQNIQCKYECHMHPWYKRV